MTDYQTALQSKRLSLFGRAGLSLIGLLCIGVTIAALRYVAPGMPGAAVTVAANAFAMPYLPVHAGFGALALLIGPLQFLPGLRRRRVRLHRTIGVTYWLACFVSGGAGLALAFGSTAGPIATAGFGLLAIAWITTTAMGAVAVLRGRFLDHRRWMIRSFTLTFAAVTLRLLLPVAFFVELDFQTWYLAVSFLCWVPNLVFAEIYILSTEGGVQNQPASRSAG